MWYVYFLRSLNKNNWIYVGSTNDIERRLTEHNHGKVKSTQPYRPFTVIYEEKHETEVEARKREDHFKYWKGRLEKKEILKSCGIVQR